MFEMFAAEIVDKIQIKLVYELQFRLQVFKLSVTHRTKLNVRE